MRDAMPIAKRSFDFHTLIQQRRIFKSVENVLGR